MKMMFMIDIHFKQYPDYVVSDQWLFLSTAAQRSGYLSSLSPDWATDALISAPRAQPSPPRRFDEALFSVTQSSFAGSALTLPLGHKQKVLATSCIKSGIATAGTALNGT